MARSSDPHPITVGKAQVVIEARYVGEQKPTTHLFDTYPDIFETGLSFIRRESDDVRERIEDGQDGLMEKECDEEVTFVMGSWPFRYW